VLACTIARMDDREYWTKQLREAERELEARRSDVDAAAKKLQRAKSELKALEVEPKRPKQSNRGSRSAGASS
jgi:multidrug resistance efflux pump